MYENPALINSSFKYLFQIYSKRLNLTTYLRDIQIIEDQHQMAVLQEAIKIKKNIMNAADDSENWWGLNSVRKFLFSNTIRKLLST